MTDNPFTYRKPYVPAKEIVSLAIVQGLASLAAIGVCVLLAELLWPFYPV